MQHLCPQCLAETVYQETGKDFGRKFDLYFCRNCENYNREWFPFPDVALVPIALSDKVTQLRMFPAARVSD